MSSMSEQPCKRPRMEIELAKVAARVSAIEEELNRPLTEIGFRKAAELITELENFGGSDNYGTLLRVAEFELQLARGKHNVALKNLKDFLEELSEPIRKDTIQTSIDLTQKGRNIASSIINWIHFELFDVTRVTPNFAVNWIRNHIEKMSFVARMLAVTGGRSRGIAIEFSVRKMITMLECLRERKPLDLHRALSEGKCLISISEVHYEAKMYNEASRAAVAGARILAQHYAQHYSKDQLRRCSIYVKLLHCVAKAHGHLGKRARAQPCAVQSERKEVIASDSADGNQRIHELRTENAKADVSAESSLTNDESS